MKKDLKRFLTILWTCSLTACAATDPKSGHEVTQINRVGDLSLVGASSRLVVKNSNGSHCFGPPPDAAFSDSMGMGVNISMLNFGDDTTSDSFDDAHIRNNLGGRNPNVLITRELLFEACLLADRAGLTPSQMVEIYKATLSTIEKINSQSLDGENITSDNPDTMFSLSDGTSTVSTSSSSADQDDEDDDD
jgi:hypothetical protein